MLPGSGGLGVSARQTRGIEAVVGRLLMAAVADTSEQVRRTVLKVRGRGGARGVRLHAVSASCSDAVLIVSLHT